MLARWLAPLGPAGATIVATWLAASASGCARVPARPDLDVPSLGAVSSSARCGVQHSADKPLVVEWPAADRAALEARAQQGLVAVRYEGCTMEVLTSCRIDGRYDFVALSPKHERVRIRNADELYARLPVGAAGLEGKLAVSGQLTVDLSVVGRQQADRHVVDHAELTGHCPGATHVLTGLTVGAFSLHAGAERELSAHARVAGAGAGGSHERAYELLARDGDPEACHAGDELDPATPPAGCRALLSIEAVPLAGRAPAPTLTPEQIATGQRRADRRVAAWRAVAITSGVLSGASFGGIVGGAVLKMQDPMLAPWEEPTPEQARRDRIGTTMLVGSTVSVLGFGALTVGAATAARRARWNPTAWVGPTIGRHGAGLQVSARF